MEYLEGHLERIVFYSGDTSYLVGRLGGTGTGTGSDTVTFVGHFPALQEGEALRLQGEWKTHPRYGRQFQVSAWEAVTPTTLKGLERFLGSGLIKGVGEHTARLLLKHFHMDVLDILEKQPQRLLEIPGIGSKRAAMIHQSYLRQKEIKEVMFFLQEYSVSPSLAVRLFKHYGSGTIPLLKENPYRLAEEVFGVGFLTADKIARKLGLPFNSPQRVRAAVVYLLNHAADHGHVYLPEGEIKEKLMELLTGKETQAKEPLEGEITPALMESQLAELARRRQVVLRVNSRGEECIYAAPFYHAEKGAAERLIDLLLRQPALLAPEEKGVIQEILQEEKLKLAPEQLEALQVACLSGVLVVTGGPGTGKTTTIRALLRLFRRYGLKILLAAPTGRAAKRMTEATGMEAKTIHRLLEYSFVEGQGFCFQRTENNPLPAQVVIVDEVSMIDLMLFFNLLKALPPGCRLILVGDIDQLPSVGAGNVLRDIIQSEALPCVRLQTIFRQARESMIVVNAHRINRGEIPVLSQKDRDFFFLAEDDLEKVAQAIVELCRERLPRFGPYDPLDDIQVLTPMRRTPVGVERLNMLLQQELNPPARHKKEVAAGGGVFFRLGDKVMQVRNNYEKEVFNGDIGRITGVNGEEGEIVVSFPEVLTHREVTYDLMEMDELVLSYAISVHKSQGSEYPVVVMPVVTQHYMLLQRNLLYTGITRAKKLVVMIGTKKAVAIAVKNNKVESRYSDLAGLLKERSTTHS